MLIRIQSDTLLNWVVTGLIDLMQVHSIGIVIILRRIRIRISAHTYVTNVISNNRVNSQTHDTKYAALVRFITE